MAQDGNKQQNTAYGVFVQACWAQHKRQYPDELIHKEIEEFNKQCSVWWYNLSEQERERFQEMADRYVRRVYPSQIGLLMLTDIQPASQRSNAIRSQGYDLHLGASLGP